MRIVIAEDSAVVRAGLAEILADRGHEVVAAVGDEDPQQAGYVHGFEGSVPRAAVLGHIGEQFGR